MAVGQGNPVRVATSELLFQRVIDGIRAWQVKRAKADPRRQHATQLAAVGAVLGRIRGELEKEKKDLSSGEAGAQYEACQRFDRRTVWLEQVWRFFQQRFDQRDNPEYAAVLGVADELVWSLYSPALQKAVLLKLRPPPAPAPLPFIEALYSPAAFPTEIVPPDLKGEGEAVSLLREHLNRMPAPVVRMAPAYVAAPWLVVYLAHEVGHHLQYDLLPERKLVTGFQQVVEAAVKRKTGSDREARRWGSWSREIFADLFSAVAMGKWAVWAMGQMVYTSAANLDRDDQNGYPPARVRLSLLAEFCDRIGGNTGGTKELARFFAPDADPVRRAVLDAALGTLPGLETSLAKFCAVDVSAFERDVAIWRKNLEEDAAQDPAQDISNAPVLTAAALGRWQTIAAANTGDQLVTAGRKLKSQLVAKVEAGAPDDGPRAGGDEANVGGLADQILNRIWEGTR